MDANNEAFLLIATSMVLLICFVIAVLAVMLIYRKRKLQHNREITEINTRFERELLRSQLEVQTQTMQHIGREIHDNVGHQLTLAYLYTHQLDNGDPRTREMGEEIGNIIDKALSDLRSLSSNLIKGQVSQSASIAELIRQECHKLKAVNFCEVTFRAEGITTNTPMEVNSFVLRIVQEFAQNSLKHARCSLIQFELTQQQDGLLLSAKDDGIGFDIHNLPESAGIGLTNMRKRAEIIGGSLQLMSAQGKGTQLELLIPTNTKEKQPHEVQSSTGR